MFKCSYNDASGSDEIEIGGEEASSGLAPIFPLSRVKKIMKADKDVHMISADAVLFTAMAAVRLMTPSI